MEIRQKNMLDYAFCLAPRSCCERGERDSFAGDNNSWVFFILGSPWIMNKWSSFCRWSKVVVFDFARLNSHSKNYKSQKESRGEEKLCCLLRQCHKIKCLFTQAPGPWKTFIWNSNLIHSANKRKETKFLLSSVINNIGSDLLEKRDRLGMKAPGN